MLVKEGKKRIEGLRAAARLRMKGGEALCPKECPEVCDEGPGAILIPALHPAVCPYDVVSVGEGIGVGGSPRGLP